MCGIAGIVSKTQRVFDYSTFCTLGISNDRRGGDSCGIFIDGAVEYGTGEDKLFENFFLGSKVLNEVRQATVALLHCRKASVGVVSEKTAQPVVLYSEEGKPLFVVIHNGTIYNYKELAEKYIPEIDITGMTDSQVMARIFFYRGYDVLSEYNGGSVFVIADYRGTSPRIFLFKGMSKTYHYSKEEITERPLFYCINKHKRELVFSSIASSIFATRRDETVYYAHGNALMEFTGRDLVIVQEIDRSKCIQTREVTVKSNPVYTPPVYSGGKRRKDDLFDAYDDYDWYENMNNRYLSTDIERNLFRVGGELCHGRLYIGETGYIHSKMQKKLPTYEVWFFHGVALASMQAFRFLTILKKESGLEPKDFCAKFENVIRFLSVDRVYPKGGYWHEAISPTGSVLFTGRYQPITASSTVSYSAGVQIASFYKAASTNMKEKLSAKRDTPNFKEIKEECKPLMK